MKKTLKIGIVVDQLLAGGVQLAAIEQIKQLNKLSHKATLLILMRKKYPTDFSYLVKDIPHQYLSDSYPAFLRKTIKFPVFSFLSTLHLLSPLLAPRVIKNSEYDILVSLGTTTCLTTQAIFKKRNIPYIAVIHDPIVYILEKAYIHTFLKYFFFVLKPLAKFFERSFVLDARQTITISKVHYAYLKNNYGINPLILGFGTNTLNKLPEKRGSHLLSFGRWQKEKNPEFLLKLIKTMPKTKLIIAGSWSDQIDRKQFEKQISKNKLTKRVTIIPHFTKKELAVLCRLSRVWIHPHFEAFGLAALEAAAHGLPIIIPQKSGVTEIFQHTVHGFFPTKVSKNEYRSFVLKLLKNERLAFTMGHDAWSLVKKRYSWKVNVKQLLQIIHIALPVDEKPNIIVLEISHALGVPLAGGDKLMEPMALRLADTYRFSIVVSSVGASHWEEANLQKVMLTLPRNRFDASGKPHFVFFAYCIRMWQAYHSIQKTLKDKGVSMTTLQSGDSMKQYIPFILYSSTNILPDILPAYFIKKKYPHKRWIARVHHLIPPPHKREGKLFVNIISYCMQSLALTMMKSLADVTIVLNKQIKKELVAKGFPSNKLRVLGGGIEVEKIRKSKPQKKITFDAVFLGRLHTTKGIFDTVPIWEHVTRIIPNARLAIIGDGPADIRKTLEKRIADANLSKNIILFGYLPYTDVYSILKQAKLFLFLDHEAGWGLAVAEAMAAGLPVVGYDTGVLGSVYKQGFQKVALGKYKDFSKQIVTLLRNRQLHQTIAREALLEADKHDWDKTSEQFNSLLFSIISP